MTGRCVILFTATFSMGIHRDFCRVFTRSQGLSYYVYARDVQDCLGVVHSESKPNYSTSPHPPVPPKKKKAYLLLTPDCQSPPKTKKYINNPKARVTPNFIEEPRVNNPSAPTYMAVIETSWKISCHMNTTYKNFILELHTLGVSEYPFNNWKFSS